MYFIRFVKVFVISLMLFLCLASCVDKKSQLTPLTIVCLGDSITYGYKLADPARQSYPAQLSKQAHGRWQVLNCGVNGATVLKKGDIPITSQKAYQRAIKSNPDVVVLLLGTNDTKHRNFQYADEFVSDYLKLVKKLESLPSQPHVIACSIPPIFGDYPNGLSAERVKEVNNLLEKAIIVSKVDSLDIYTATSRKQSFFIDGIHPNARGAGEIANLVFNKITSL